MIRTKPGRWLALLLVLLVAACGGPPSQPLPPIALTVDPSLAPSVDALPGFADGEPRPLAVVTGDGGTTAEFVANELWLRSEDDAQLQALLDRWHGTVLQSLSVPGAGGATTHYLVRVDAAAADLSRLPDDLRALDPHATGDHRVSSQAGLDLIAAAGHEAAGGLALGLNFVGEGAQRFRERISNEAPTGGALAGIAYDPNAFTWPSHNLGASSVQQIGVAEAWRALQLAGVHDTVKVAVLDMGFSPDADWSSGYTAIGNVPLTPPIGTANLLGCGSGNPCPWHGTEVVSALMALPDNGYGSAGPAGPVARPIAVFTLYDFFTSISALLAARLDGAKIANMSYAAPVPWYLGWSVLPFEAATAGMRATGMLLFAAAGNDGKDVDAEGCTLGACWERTWYTPCENAGVICVGGLRPNSTQRAASSNYGHDQVDIFAPFTLWLGPDPDHGANQVQTLSGTSFSSPFAAGVAALVWAADPSLGADGVENLLYQTAHASNDPDVGRYVNALGAVKAALGNIPPSIELGAGGDVPLDVELTLDADVTDFEDAFPCCSVTWTSNVDGALGSGYSVTHTFTTQGPRTVTVTAVDSGGATSHASMQLNVVNYAPEPAIAGPADGASLYRGAKTVLRGRADDRNEPDGALACDRLVWTSSVGDDAFPLTGCELEVAFDTDGERTLTLSATDPQGASATDTVTVNVVAPPPNLPPFVHITGPHDHANVPYDQPIALTGGATDPEGATDLTYAWTVQLGNGAPVTVGNAPTGSWTPSDTFDFGAEGTYTVTIRLRATDPDAQTGEDSVVLEWHIIL